MNNNIVKTKNNFVVQKEYYTKCPSCFKNLGAIVVAPGKMLGYKLIYVNVEGVKLYLF